MHHPVRYLCVFVSLCLPVYARDFCLSCSVVIIITITIYPVIPFTLLGCVCNVDARSVIWTDGRCRRPIIYIYRAVCVCVCGVVA